MAVDSRSMQRAGDSPPDITTVNREDALAHEQKILGVNVILDDTRVVHRGHLRRHALQQL